MSRLLSVAHLTAISLPPPDFIRAAARAGFDAVGLRLRQVTPETPGYPLDDPVQLSATLAALADTGLSVHDIEFVRITPDLDPATLAPLLETGAALGARHLICAPYDPDLPRLSARLARITDLARARGLGVVLEFFPWTPVPDLAAALRVTEGTGAGVLVDALHFDRSGSSADLLRATDPSRLPFAHLCDAPVHPPYTTEDLLHAARAERLPPGEGQIDLAGWLAALPGDCPLAVEVPMTALTRQVGPDAVLRRLAETARRLAKADGRAGSSAPRAAPVAARPPVSP